MFVLKPAAVGAMVAMFALFCAGGAAADKGSFTSLVAQLDDPLMKEIIGSMQAQLEIERQDYAEMQGQIAALQADSGAKQTQIDSLLTRVEQHTTQVDNCLSECAECARPVFEQDPVQDPVLWDVGTWGR